MICDIYRSSKRDEMYLYVARPAQQHQEQQHNQACAEEDQPADPFVNVPESMQKAFGRATFVMQLELTEQRKLARVSTMRVLDALQTQGYFVQMPPDGLINPNAVAPEGLRGA